MRASRDIGCIYCGSLEPPKGREHVIPQAFGTFANNWTLDCVCDECNAYFAKELELPFARDSAEAHLRLHHGLKPPGAAFQLLNRRSEMKLVEHDFLDGAGVSLIPDKAGSQVLPFPYAQVGFRNGEQPWVYISVDRLTEECVAPFKAVSPLEIRIIGNDDLNPQRIVERLAELGIVLTQGGRVQGGFDGHIMVEHHFTLDAPILRAIGKISFNYAAKVFGAKFVRQADFNPFRKFVRFGELPDWAPVSLATQRVVKAEPGQVANAHWCAADWTADGSALVTQLSFFNEHAYQVILCVGFNGDRCAPAIAHAFDPFTRCISELLISPTGC